MIQQRCAICKRDRSIHKPACPSCGSRRTCPYRAIVKRQDGGPRLTHSGKTLNSVIQAHEELKAKAKREAKASKKKAPATRKKAPSKRPKRLPERSNVETSSPSDVMTLADVWVRYRANAEARGKKSVKDDARRWAKHVKPRLGSRAVVDIKPGDIQGIVDDCLTVLGLAPATALQVFALIRAMMNFADRMGLVPDSFRSPCRRVVVPRFDNRVENPLSVEDFVTLEGVARSWVNQFTGRVVLFAMFSGRRLGEILKLKWSCVDHRQNR